MSEVWLLYHEGAVAAKLHVVDSGFPWLRAHRGEAAGLRGHRGPLFDKEVRLVDEVADTVPAEWTGAYEAIRAQTRLTYQDGRGCPSTCSTSTAKRLGGAGPTHRSTADRCCWAYYAAERLVAAEPDRGPD